MATAPSAGSSIQQLQAEASEAARIALLDRETAFV